LFFSGYWVGIPAEGVEQRTYNRKNVNLSHCFVNVFSARYQKLSRKEHSEKKGFRGKSQRRERGRKKRKEICSW